LVSICIVGSSVERLCCSCFSADASRFHRSPLSFFLDFWILESWLFVVVRHFCQYVFQRCLKAFARLPSDRGYLHGSKFHLKTEIVTSKLSDLSSLTSTVFQLTALSDIDRKLRSGKISKHWILIVSRVVKLF
jgi:hypothetical protein